MLRKVEKVTFAVISDNPNPNPKNSAIIWNQRYIGSESMFE